MTGRAAPPSRRRRSAPATVPRLNPAWKRGMIDAAQMALHAAPWTFIATSQAPLANPNRNRPDHHGDDADQVPERHHGQRRAQQHGHRRRPSRRESNRCTMTPASGSAITEPAAIASSTSPSPDVRSEPVADLRDAGRPAGEREPGADERDIGRRVAAARRGCASTSVLSRVFTSGKCTQQARTRGVADDGLLRKIDAVTVPVPDLDQGLQFYRTRSGTICCGATTAADRPACGCRRRTQRSC